MGPGVVTEAETGAVVADDVAGVMTDGEVAALMTGTVARVLGTGCGAGTGAAILAADKRAGGGTDAVAVLATGAVRTHGITVESVLVATLFTAGARTGETAVGAAGLATCAGFKAGAIEDEELIEAAFGAVNVTPETGAMITKEVAEGKTITAGTSAAAIVSVGTGDFLLAGRTIISSTVTVLTGTDTTSTVLTVSDFVVRTAGESLIVAAKETDSTDLLVSGIRTGRTLGATLDGLLSTSEDTTESFTGAWTLPFNDDAVAVAVMLEAEVATGTSHAGADNAEDTDSGEKVLESEDGDFIGVPDGDRGRSPGRKVASGLYVSLSTFFATLLAGMAKIEVRADRLTVPTLTTGQATFGTAALEPTASLRAALSTSSPFWSEAPVAAAVYVTSSPFSGPFNDTVAVAALTAALVSVDATGTTGTSHAGSDNAGLEIDPWSTDSGACALNETDGGDFTGVPDGDLTGVSEGGRVVDEPINSFLAVSFSTLFNTLLAGIAKIDLRDDRCFA
jgi:hypothetical protein